MFKRKKKIETESKVPRPRRFATIRDAYDVTKKEKPLILLWCIAIFLPVIILGVVFGVVVGHPIYFTFISIPLALLASFFFFTRQAGSAAYASIEGQLGAGASVLMAVKKGWTTTPAVSVSRNQDMVHRCVGRLGIVLVGEGSPGVRLLINDERRKMERFAPGVPIAEVIVGSGEGQIALRKLQRHMKKFPKKLSVVQLRELRARLKSVGGLTIPLPKGPMPKNVRMPKR